MYVCVCVCVCVTMQVEAGLREQVSSQAQQIQSLEVRLKAAMNANERLMDENANRSQRIVQLEALLARWVGARTCTYICV